MTAGDRRSGPGAGRRRDAGATRAALLSCAQDLFGAKGYERTTTREIGESAGVDPALIARYFGSKADLYLAAVAAEPLDDPDGVEDAATVGADGDADAPYGDLAEVVGVVLRRTGRRGPGPILQALIRDDASAEIRDAARARLLRRVVAPVVVGYREAGVDEPDLVAQVAVAALLGVGLGRTLGWFDALGAASDEDLATILVEAFTKAG